MKIRSLHPDFFSDGRLAGLPFEARLLFAGLWCHSDDHGRGRWLPKRIEGDVFPHDDVNINELLGLLVDAGRVRRYDVDGESFYEIPTWEEYQSPKYRAKSSVPEPPGQTPTDQSGQDSTQFAQDCPQRSPEFSPGEGEGEGVIEPSVREPQRPPKGAGPKELAVHVVLEDKFGIPSDTEMGLRRRIAKSVMSAGGDPGEVHRRCDAWDVLFPNGGRKLRLTPTALDKWWGQLGKVLEDQPSEFDPDLCVHPVGRRAVFDDAEFCGMCRREVS